MPADDDTPPPRGTPTIRETYALIERVETKLMGELTKLEAKLDRELAVADQGVSKWQTDHLLQHGRDAVRRWAVTAWAVTTLLTAGGLLFTIVWTVTHRPHP